MASDNPFQLFAFQGRAAEQAVQMVPNSAKGIPSPHRTQISYPGCEIRLPNVSQAAGMIADGPHQHATLQQRRQPEYTAATANDGDVASSSAACLLQHGPIRARSPQHSRGQPSSSQSSSGKAAHKRQRATCSTLSGEPQGLPEKLGAAPLRLVLVGHNPSEHAWYTGHYYSNPSNRMWPILIKTGIAPPGSTGCEADDEMSAAVGVGFTDVGSGQPGTDSSKFKSKDFQGWRQDFYDRLMRHVKEASDNIGCVCGQCGAPAVIAFTGKRHYMELMNLDISGNQLKGKAKVSPATVQLGRQPANQLPPGWPLPADKSEIWVLTSTSGAAPLSNADRERPYAQLAERLTEIPWPRGSQHLQCGRRGYHDSG